MPSSRRKSTWAILSPSKLLPGSKALDLLGCVVADINNPTDYYRPKNIQATLQSLHEVISVQEEDVEIVLSSLYSAGVGLRLTQILRGGRERGEGAGTTVRARTVVTRWLEHHPDVVRTLDEKHRAEILELLATKHEKKGRGFLVVGVKTCLDARLVDVSRLTRSHDAGVEVPVDVILAASGVVVPGAQVLNPGVDGHQEQVKSVLTRYTAPGERVFALQYLQVMRHKDWLHFSEPPTLKHGGLQEIPVDRAMYGYQEEGDGKESVEEYDDVKIADDKLEIGDRSGIAIEMNDVNDDMLIADI